MGTEGTSACAAIGHRASAAPGSLRWPGAGCCAPPTTCQLLAALSVAATGAFASSWRASRDAQVKVSYAYRHERVFQRWLRPKRPSRPISGQERPAARRSPRKRSATMCQMRIPVRYAIEYPHREPPGMFVGFRNLVVDGRGPMPRSLS